MLAAGINTGPPPVGNWTTPVGVVGELPQDHGAVVLHQTNDKYAKTMSIRIVRGRYFTEQDAIACLNFAVVNEAFVRRFLAGRDTRLRSAPFKSGQRSAPDRRSPRGHAKPHSDQSGAA